MELGTRRGSTASAGGPSGCQADRLRMPAHGRDVRNRGEGGEQGQIADGSGRADVRPSLVHSLVELDPGPRGSCERRDQHQRRDRIRGLAEDGPEVWISNSALRRIILVGERHKTTDYARAGPTPPRRSREDARHVRGEG